MFSIHFTDLTPGQLDVAVQDGEQYATVRATYLSDGPGDLARAVLALKEATSSSRCVWPDGSEGYVWELVRAQDDVSLTIAWVKDTRVEQAFRREVFQARCPLRQLRDALAAQLETLETLYGPTGYERRWRCPFPSVALQALRAG